MTGATSEPLPPVDFEAETRPEGGGGRYQMKIPWGWEGAPGVPYGGWTTAVALRAAGLESQLPRPASLAAQFVRPLSLGQPLDLDVDVLRRGRRTETIAVTVSQGGEMGVHALVTAVASAPGLEYEPERTPSPLDLTVMPTLGEVIRREGELPEGHHIEHYEYRVPDDRSDDTVVNADGKQALVGWIRYGEGVAYDDPWVESARYCVPADTQVPAAFLRAGMLGSPGDHPIRATTIDLLLHFHRTERATDWLWHETHVQVAHDGLASGICNLWSDAGAILATSMSQVAFLTPPPA